MTDDLLVWEDDGGFAGSEGTTETTETEDNES